MARAGATVGALALAAVVVLAATHVSGSTHLHSASPATHRSTSPSTGSTGSSAGRTRDDAPSASATAATPQANAGLSSVPPEFALGRAPDVVTVDRPPSGRTVRVDVGQDVLVVPPPGLRGWGHVSLGNVGHPGHPVLSPLAQAGGSTAGQILLRAAGPGRAVVSVASAPSARGTPTVWRVTVVVRDGSTFRCPDGTARCRRPAGSGPTGG